MLVPGEPDEIHMQNQIARVRIIEYLD